MVGLRKLVPDRRVLRPEHPGAEPLQAALSREFIAVVEGMGVRHPYPFTHLVAVEPIERLVILCVPLNPGPILFRQWDRLVSIDVVSRDVGALFGPNYGVAREPVV